MKLLFLGWSFSARLSISARPLLLSLRRCTADAGLIEERASLSNGCEVCCYFENHLCEIVKNKKVHSLSSFIPL